jgi:hypothetical protein
MRQNVIPFSVTIADPTADKVYPIFKVPAGFGQMQVISAIAGTDVALAEGDTNVIALTLQDGGAAGTGTAAITSELSNKATGSHGAWAGGTGAPKVFNVANEVLLDEGDVLTLKYDETGTVAPLNIVVSGFAVIGQR